MSEPLVYKIRSGIIEDSILICNEIFPSLFAVAYEAGTPRACTFSKAFPAHVPPKQRRQ
jgi:hypothetical protein